MKMTYLLRRCIRHFFIGISSVSTRFIPVILIAVVIAASPVLAEDKAKLSTIVPKDLGDGGQIEDAWLGGLKDLVIDDEGNLYFPDLVFSVVLKLTPSGQVIRIAGTGVGGFSGDNGPATEAQLNEPYSLALDPDGILYISDFGNNRVRAVNLSPNPLNQIPPGFIVTVAGNGDFGYSGDDGLATAATLAFPRGLAVHADAPNELPNLYISDVDNHAIRRVDGVTKIISTVAGTGLEDCATLEGIPDPPPCSPLGDGGPAKQAAVSFPNGVAFDDYGNLFISEIYGRVRKVKNGIISTVGGVGPGLHGKKGPLSKLQLVPNPHDPTFDPQGNLFLCDTDNHRVYRFNAINGEVTAQSTVTPVAGSGFMDGVGAGYYSLSDIGNRATQASVDRPTGLAEYAGRLYLVQESGVIRYVEGGGNGLVDGGGDEKIFDIGALGGLKEIFGIAAYGGDVFATEIRAGRIRRVDGAGQLSTAAGTAVQAFSIDGPGKDLSDDPGVALLAGDAVFGQLLRLGFDAAGNLYVTDWYAILGIAGSVRRIQAGGGPIGPSSPIETLIELPFVPVGIAVESENRQYISDPVGLRIWAIENNNGLVTLNPIAGTGAFGHTGDDGPALNADIGTVYGLALDETQEHLYFGERDFGAIRRVNLSTGVISTVFVLDSPDGECCPAAPSDLVVSGNNLYVVDVAYSRIFRIDLSTFDSTLIAGGNSGVFNGDGIATEVNLDNPVAIASDPQQGILYTGEGHGQRIRRLEVEKK